MKPIHLVALAALLLIAFFLGLAGCQEQIAREQGRLMEPAAAQEVITPPTVPQVAAAPTVYVVKDGDTLSEIAETHYGTWKSYPKLAAFNKLSNPHLIYPGQSIRL